MAVIVLIFDEDENLVAVERRETGVFSQTFRDGKILKEIREVFKKKPPGELLLHPYKIEMAKKFVAESSVIPEREKPGYLQILRDANIRDAIQEEFRKPDGTTKPFETTVVGEDGATHILYPVVSYFIDP